MTYQTAIQTSRALTKGQKMIFARFASAAHRSGPPPEISSGTEVTDVDGRPFCGPLMVLHVASNENCVVTFEKDSGAWRVSRLVMVWH